MKNSSTITVLHFVKLLHCVLKYLFTKKTKKKSGSFFVPRGVVRVFGFSAPACRIDSLDRSSVENHLRPRHGRIINRVGRLDDQLRNWVLLLYQSRRAVMMHALEMQTQVHSLTIRLAACLTLVRPLTCQRIKHARV